MKILYVTAGYLPDGIGGVELHLEGLCRVLSEDHELLIFRRGADSQRAEFEIDEYEHQGVRVVRVNYLFSDATSFMTLVENASIRDRFASELTRFAPDLVHIHHLTCLTTLIVDACREASIPVVLSLHDFWLGCPRGQRLTSALSPCEKIERERCLRCWADTWPQFFGDNAEKDVFERYHARVRATLEGARVLIAPSPFCAEKYVAEGVPRDRIRIIPYGIEKSRFVPREAPSSGARVFGYIGTLLPSKGVHVLLDAFSRLLSRLPSELADELTLEIHGAAFPYHNDPWYEERLRRMARPLGDRVRFHGRYENESVPGILSSFDALVVPSIWFETWGIVVREAFLAGVPVVASAFGALGDGIVDGETGLSFGRGDAEALTSSMRRLVEDPSLVYRLADSPKEVWSVEENARAVLEAYRGAVDFDPPPSQGTSPS